MRAESGKSGIGSPYNGTGRSVKAEMDTSGVSSMTVGGYTVKYTRYFSNRFDSKAFRAEHEALYDTYMKPVPMSRFTVTN